MRWHIAVLVLGTLAVAGCSDQASAIASADVERERIVDRTLALQAAVTATGRITADHRRELEAIKRDIGAWQGRTGRDDLSMSASEPEAELGTSALVSRDPSGPSCDPCPAVKADGTYICFLSEEGPCGEPGGLITRVCSYVCIKVGITPIKSR